MNRRWTDVCTFCDLLKKYADTDVGSSVRKTATLVSGNFKVPTEDVNAALIRIIDVLEIGESSLRICEDFSSVGKYAYADLMCIGSVFVEYSMESRWFYLHAYYFIGQEAASMKWEILDYAQAKSSVLSFESRLKVVGLLIGILKKMWAENQLQAISTAVLTN